MLYAGFIAVIGIIFFLVKIGLARPTAFLYSFDYFSAILILVVIRDFNDYGTIFWEAVCVAFLCFIPHLLLMICGRYPHWKEKWEARRKEKEKWEKLCEDERVRAVVKDLRKKRRKEKFKEHMAQYSFLYVIGGLTAVIMLVTPIIELKNHIAERRVIDEMIQTAQEYLEKEDYETAYSVLDHDCWEKMDDNSKAAFEITIGWKLYVEGDLSNLPSRLERIEREFPPSDDYWREKLKELKVLVEADYEDWNIEHQRKKEKELLDKHRERAYAADYPYVGMPAMFLDLTKAGEAIHSGKIVKNGYTVDQYYYSEVFAKKATWKQCCDVATYDGKVVYVNVDGEISGRWPGSQLTAAEEYKKSWEDPQNKAHKNSSSKSSSRTPYDPYDVYDYLFPEDFYEDHYDDFYDFEDAEDYFNEKHGVW
ncbi:MAG: hypothetical protein IJA99_07000 [Oscillospiraceae bacterium]|nr:hypothetical protein [Oscillospiraceae bacterium]